MRSLNTLIIIVCVVLIFINLNNRREIKTEKRELVKGKKEIVFEMGKEELAVIPKRKKKVFKTELNKLNELKKDASIILIDGKDSLVISANDEDLNFNLSIHYEDTLRIRVDTMRITEVDTLQILKEIRSEENIYDSWWFKAGAGVAAVAVVYLAIKK